MAPAPAERYARLLDTAPLLLPLGNTRGGTCRRKHLPSRHPTRSRMFGLTGISPVDDWAGRSRPINGTTTHCPLGRTPRVLLLVAVLALVAVRCDPVFGGAACRASRLSRECFRRVGAGGGWHPIDHAQPSAQVICARWRTRRTTVRGAWRVPWTQPRCTRYPAQESAVDDAAASGAAADTRPGPRARGALVTGWVPCRIVVRRLLRQAQRWHIGNSVETRRMVHRRTALQGWHAASALTHANSCRQRAEGLNPGERWLQSLRVVRR